MTRDRQPHSLTFVLFIWLTPQLLSLALSATRVPLSAHPPRPIESVAIEQMLIVQIVSAAMLVPLLFESRTAIVATIVSAAPMLQLAAFLSSLPTRQTLIVFLLLASWMLMLGAARQWLISTIATTWSLGGLVLAYLHTEFAAQQNFPATLFGPAYVAMHSVAAQDASPTLWFLMGTFTTLAFAMVCAARYRRRLATAP